VRKPGAFAAYRYRDDLFPTTTFRLAYDREVSGGVERADRNYVRLLQAFGQHEGSRGRNGSCPALGNKHIANWSQLCGIWFIHLTRPRSWPSPRPRLYLSSYDNLIPGSENSCLIHKIDTTNSTHFYTPLNLGAMADVFADVALRAAKEGLSHEAYLYELARQELEQRTEARVLRDWCGLQDYL
jgi:hypothetical protein